MFRHHRGVLRLGDFDEYDDEPADAATVHRYIARAYHESVNKLYEYEEDRKASIRKRARRKADDCRRQRLSGRTDRRREDDGRGREDGEDGRGRIPRGPTLEVSQEAKQT